MAAAKLLLLLLLLLSPLLFSSAGPQPNAAATKAALLILKSSFADPSPLASWSESSFPCGSNMPEWAGVVCDGSAVIGLRLESLSLSGFVDVDALSLIKSLRTLSFSNNSLSGPIPAFNKIDGLKTLYLSGNSFHGPIPGDFFAEMDHLKKLHLSENQFSGAVPSSISKAALLIELNLRGNHFSGMIPALDLPSLQYLDLSHNQLTGPIPAAFASRFKEDSFSNNSGLCGPPLAGYPCPALPPAPPAPPPPTSQGGRSGGGGKTAQIVIGLVILAALAMAIVVMLTRQKQPAAFDKLDVNNGGEMEAGVGGAQRKGVPGRKGHRRAGEADGAAGELVMVSEEKGAFGLGDLMRAAAEMLGSGGLGSAYKAMMADGTAVTVKRMREMNRAGKAAFDAEIRRLGRLRHANVLPPLAYHFRKDEKLLVFQYVPKGSLLFILHGDRGADHAALDWPTRLKIVVGIARGTSYLHAELSSLDVPHGNLKSCNVFLSPDFDPLLVDYGFLPLVDPSAAPRVMFAYKSPEYSLGQCRVSPKSDVYCLGVIILEVLTCKFPAQYLNNSSGGTDAVAWANAAVREDRVAELIDPAIIVNAKSAVPEMERLIRVGVACAEADPDVRIDMKEACRRIEEIAADAKKAAATIEAAPSVMEGCGDTHESAVRGGFQNESSVRGAGSVSDGSREQGDDFAFAIS